MLAVIAAVAETQDPKLNGCRRDGDGVARAVRLCLERAGFQRDDIRAVVAGGSWTRTSQQAEMAALRNVFGNAMPPIYATVEQTGFLPAAGALFGLAAGVRLVADGSARHVLITGSDITGPHAAMIISHP